MKKGFTLIELLAVIVILAIIALIATPMIMDVIEKARIGAVKETVNGYIESIQNEVVVGLLEQTNDFKNTTCNLNNDEMICSNETKFQVKVKGDKLDELNIIFTDKEIIESGTFRKSNYCGTYRKNRGVEFISCNPLHLNASEVKYTPDDSSWQVSTVEEALNALKEELSK